MWLNRALIGFNLRRPRRPQETHPAPQNAKGRTFLPAFANPIVVKISLLKALPTLRILLAEFARTARLKFGKRAVRIKMNVIGAQLRSSEPVAKVRRN